MSHIYRYPGAQPFNAEQRHIFFGRERDVEALYQLISLEQMVVLYAKSGLGKSSLINAGMLPRLETGRSLLPLSVRFGAFNPENELLASPLETALAQTQAQSELLQRIAPEKEQSLWYNLKSHQMSGTAKKGVLLVFDQFEELFTYPPAQVHAFAQQMAEVLYTAIPDRYRALLEQGFQADNNFFSTSELQQLHAPMEVKVLIAIRSDRMSLLNRLKPFLASILLHTYELDALSVEQAEDAILNPAYQQNGFRSPQFDYEDTAVLDLIDFLSDGRKSAIESFQLQILCEYVEQEVVLKGGKQIVTSSDLANPQGILENYYLQKLEDFPPENRLAVRRLIEEGLIFEEEERRLTLYEGQIEKTYQIGAELLRQLLDTHLIRSEPSLRGGYTYELSHDTLVAPVLKAKAKRVEVERRDREAELRRQQAAELAAERRKSQRARLIAVIGFCLAALAIAASIVAVQQSQRAKAALAEAQRQEQLAKDKAAESESRLQQFLKEEAQRKALEVQKIIDQAKADYNAGYQSDAIEQLKGALKLQPTAADSNTILQILNQYQQ